MPQLTGDYRYEVLDSETFRPLFEKHRHAVFSALANLGPEQTYSETEREAVTALQEKLLSRYTLRVGIFCGEAFVGWHADYQADAGRFYMMNTGILAAHRRRGLYSALLPAILETVRAEGFQIVFSRHHATNNEVVIPKLKAGFVITGLELDDRYGSMVQLSYFFSPLRRKLLDVRVGHSLPDDEVKKFLT